MARDNRIKLPSSFGGIVRYSDESTSKIEIKPVVIILLAVILIVIEFLLYKYARTPLGLIN